MIINVGNEDSGFPKIQNGFWIIIKKRLMYIRVIWVSEVGVMISVSHVLERQHSTNFLTSALERLKCVLRCGTKFSLDGEVSTELLQGILFCAASLEHCFSPSNLAPCFVMLY